MSRLTQLIYGTFSYAVFFAVFLYAIGFIGNFLVPKTIDGVATLPLLEAIFINIGLLTIFAIQHSVMARPVFKKWWKQFVPDAVERSTYVLFSSIALAAVFYYWQPIGGTIWQTQSIVAITMLYTLYAAGWTIVLVATFLINHFDLFGLRQVYLNFKNKPYTPLPFKTPSLYRIVRHPLYVGWLIVFWATPTMTATHLLFAVIVTAYIVIALRWEERDLVKAHPEYIEYQKRVPALIPSLGNRSTIGIEKGSKLSNG